MGRRLRLAAAGKQRGQHLLGAAHQKVGLTIALDECFDSAVFAIDLLAQEVAFVARDLKLVLKLRDIARRPPCRSRFCRDPSWPVDASCRGSCGGIGASMTGGTVSVAACRMVSRAVAASCRGSCGYT